MKKKFISFVFSCCLLISCLFMLVGCGHNHSFGDWQADETKHWKVCGCGEKTNEASHSFEGGNCSVCGKDEPENASEGLEFRYASWLEDSWAVCSIGTCGDSIITIPSTYQGLPVVKIDYQAFATEYSNSPDIIEKIIIPSSITEIGQYAFRYRSCEIEFVNPTITEIGSRAFDSYMGTTIPLPRSVNKIGSSAYSNNGRVTEIVIPNTITEIEFGAFSLSSNLESVTFEAGTTIEELPDSLFNSCEKLEGFEVPASVKRLTSRTDYYLNDWNGTFRDVDCVVTFEEGSSLQFIGEYYFQGFLGTVILPESYTEIDENAFFSMKGGSVVVSNKVTKIASKGLCAWEVNLVNYPPHTIYFTGTQTEWESIDVVADSLSQSLVVYYVGEWSYVNGIPTPNAE